MNHIHRNGMVAIAMLCAGAFNKTDAATVTLDALDSGFYNSAGVHMPNNQTYITGRFGNENRSFLVFDTSSVSGTILGATLRLFNPEVSQFLHGYVSPDATETLNIYDVSTPASDIRGNTAGLAGFADLGSGTLLGTRTVSAADNGTVIEIQLNAAGVAALTSSSGLFVLGGALGSLSGTADQYVFGFSTASFVPDHTRQLVLDVEPVPEPATIGLAGFGALLVAASRWAKGRRARA